MGSGWSQDQDSQQNQELRNTSPQRHHNDTAVLNEDPRKIMPQSSKSTETNKKMEDTRVLNEEPRKIMPQSSKSKSTETNKKMEATRVLNDEPRKIMPQSSKSTETNKNMEATRVLNDEPRKIMPQSSKSTETNKKMEATRVLRFPHNYEEILKEADSSVDRSSLDKLYDQLYAGVFLNQKRKKYWVDKKSNGNCFMLYARDLLITWGENNRFWHWPLVQESSDELLPAAELLDVCWLEIHGRFNTARLSPGLIYEVVFIVMIKDPAYGWENPVNLRLILPDGSRQGHTENMVEKPLEKWIEIPAGEFMTSANQKNGEIEFSLYEYEGGNWKRGLVIKGAVLRAKD
ncbi:hypothetical protein BC332_04034 [Capsicum chinense]|nr:hypothetical protein BC332_04034 [Capsicum chinense]